MGKVTLRDYFEAVLHERDKAIAVALESNEKRLDALNELRGDVATKTQLDALKERIDRMEGRSSGMKDGWGWIIGAAGAALAAARWLWS
jgi:hypothetical protein